MKRARDRAAVRNAAIADMAAAMALCARRAAQLDADPLTQAEAVRDALAGPLGVLIDLLETAHPRDSRAQAALCCFGMLQAGIALATARAERADARALHTAAAILSEAVA